MSKTLKILGGTISVLLLLGSLTLGGLGARYYINVWWDLHREPIQNRYSSTYGYLNDALYAAADREIEATNDADAIKYTRYFFGSAFLMVPALTLGIYVFRTDAAPASVRRNNNV